MSIDGWLQTLEVLWQQHRGVSIFIFLVLWGLWNWASKKVVPTQEQDPFLNLRIKLAKGPLESLVQLFKQVASTIQNVSDLEIAHSEALSALNEVVEQFLEYSNSVNTRLNEHIEKVFKIMGGNVPEHMTNENTPDHDTLMLWRVAGGIFSFVLLILFLYTDLVQGVNNIGVMFPKEIQHFPESVTRLGYSIVISSAGMIFTLSFIMVDALGLTHFLPWEGVRLRQPEKSKSLRGIVFCIACFTMLGAITLLAIIALPRALYVEILMPGGAKLFVRDALDGWSPWISLAAAIAHALLIVPTLITTALLFWGIMGVVALYGIGIEILRVFSNIVKGTAFLLSKTIKLLKPTGKLFLQFVLIMILTVFVVAALVVGTILIVVESITRAVVAIVQLLLYPFVILSDVVSVLARLAKSLKN